MDGANMPEDISVQILSQASENIQKLFDLSTRIDERVKSIQENQKHLDQNIDELFASHNILTQKVVVLESKDTHHKIENLDSALNALDKRVASVESTSGQNQNRWEKITGFVIQLVWILLAAWLLTTLKLQAPAVP